MRMATKRQMLELVREDSMTLTDAIGLNPGDIQFSEPQESSKAIRISVRPGMKEFVPEKISVVIDGEELLVDFELDENFQVYLPL